MARKTAEMTGERLDIEEGETYEVVTDGKRQRQMNDAEEKLFEFWEASISSNMEGEIILKKLEGTGNCTQRYLERVPVDKFSYWEMHDYIRDKYGGGDFRLLLIGPDPRKGGVRGQLNNQLISILAPPKNGLVPVGSSGGDSIANALLEEMRQMRQDMMTSQNKSPVDQIKEMAVMVTALKEVFGIQGAPAAPPSPINQLKEMMQTMQMMEEMKVMLGGGSEPKDENSLMSVLKDSAPQLLGIVSNLTHPANRAQTPKQRRPQPKPQAKPVPEQKSPVDITPPKEEVDVNAMLNQALPELLQAAKLKADPEEMALAILDRLPSMFHAKLAAELVKPDIVDRVVAAEPRFEPYREWVENVVEYAKGHLGYPCKFDAEFDDEGDDTVDDEDGEGGEEGDEDLTDTQEAGQTDENSSDSAHDVD